jgi:hypothetical protein
MGRATVRNVLLRSGAQSRCRRELPANFDLGAALANCVWWRSQ